MSKYIQIYNPSFSFEIEIILNVSSIKEDFNMLYSRKLNKHSNSFILSPILSIQKITDNDNAFWFRYIYYDDIYSGIILTYEELLDMKYIEDFGYYSNRYEIGFRCNQINNRDFFKFSRPLTLNLYKHLTNYRFFNKSWGLR